ncbi:hypothetical protein JZO73_00745, partial [Enterococcus plantarum]|nr:hypothetical protein [Enterococcus plantarum]
VGGLGYTDPRFLAFANSTALADNVQAFQKKVTEADEKQRKTKEKDLNSMTPSEMIAKYGVDDPDVKKRINDINNGISYTALNKLKDGMENIVFPINQDIAMGLSEEWLTNNGDLLATSLYNTGTKYFGGTEVASGFYAGSKIAGAASKAMPIIGSVIDYGSMVANGESANDAAAKTGAHFITGVGVGLGVAALGLSGGLAVVAGVGAAWLINEFIVDPL